MMKLTLELKDNELVRTLEHNGKVVDLHEYRFSINVEDIVKTAVVNKFYNDTAISLLEHPFLQPFFNIGIK